MTMTDTDINLGLNLDDTPGPSMTGMTIEEFTNSLTGFEEIAIAKAFGREMQDLPGTQPLRALVMVWHKRGGDDDATAYQAAMNLPLNGCMGYFDDDDEVTPDRPETESGKDG